MNKFLLLFGTLLFIGCGKSVDCEEVLVGDIIEFQLGDTFCVNDTEVYIASIDDQRCGCLEVCVWQGEFIFNLEISDNTETMDFQIFSERELLLPIPFGLNLEYMEPVEQAPCKEDIDLESFSFRMRI